ncbi:MAG: hypothetical protein ACLRMZ_00935 [Blautia marasmi]
MRTRNDGYYKREDASTGDFRSDNQFLLGYFEEKDHALYYRYDAERVIVEPWGETASVSAPQDAPDAGGALGTGR